MIKRKIGKIRQNNVRQKGEGGRAAEEGLDVATIFCSSPNYKPSIKKDEVQSLNIIQVKLSWVFSVTIFSYC